MQRVCIVLCLVLAGPALADELPAPTGDAIVPAGAKLELLFTRTAPIQGGLTEGPAAAPDGTIYFSDIPLGQDKGMILRFDPRTKKTTVFATDSRKANGLCFDSAGRLVACEGADGGGRGLARWDVKTGQRVVLVDRYMGKRFSSCNDLIIDGKDNIYFTDPRYLGDEKRELEHLAVYRLAADGKLVEVTHDVEKPNGIALSPDGRTLYVADHNNGTDRIDPSQPAPTPGAMKILAFPLGADGLVKGPARTVIDFGKGPGCDGMTVDIQGNIYLTIRQPGRPGVLVIDPQGKEQAFIPTGPSQPGAREPVGLPSNVEFGRGQEKTTLYITVDKSLYRIPLKIPGYRP